MRIRAALLLLMTMWMVGCVNIERGATMVNVRTGSWSEEKIIRRELWQVFKASEEVKLRYGLTDIAIVIQVRDLGGLGQARPGLNRRLEVDSAVVLLNERLFLEEYPELDAIITGLIAHEMAHALHYARMSTADAATLGAQYARFMRRKPESGPLFEWVRAYERLTDLTAIGLGYGEELVHQKRAARQNLARNDPPAVWDFYLTEPEIRTFMADRDALRDAVEASLQRLKLPSLARLRDALIFDEDGDALPPSRRVRTPRLPASEGATPPAHR